MENGCGQLKMVDPFLSGSLLEPHVEQFLLRSVISLFKSLIFSENLISCRFSLDFFCNSYCPTLGSGTTTGWIKEPDFAIIPKNRPVIGAPSDQYGNPWPSVIIEELFL